MGIRVHTIQRWKLPYATLCFDLSLAIIHFPWNSRRAISSLSLGFYMVQGKWLQIPKCITSHLKAFRKRPTHTACVCVCVFVCSLLNDMKICNFETWMPSSWQYPLFYLCPSLSLSSFLSFYSCTNALKTINNALILKDFEWTKYIYSHRTRSEQLNSFSIHNW